MEVKKSQKADLEGKKSLFLEIGLVTSLLLMIGAFAWGQGKREVPAAPEAPEEFVQVEEIENTVQDTPVPQVPTPASVMSVITDNIQIVDNSTDIETEQVFVDLTEDAGVGEANVAEVVADEPDFWTKVEFMPKFQGKEYTAFRTWVGGRVQYPDMAREMGIQGTVMVRFVVNTDGTLRNIEVISNTDKTLNNEVLRIVRQSPKWEPGRQGTRTVPVQVQVPITFRLQ